MGRREHKAKPWQPVEYDEADHRAVIAISQGVAAADQQRRAYEWIVFASGFEDMSFRPGGLEGQRETDFAEGRKFVGRQIVKLVQLNPDVHKKEGQNA